MKVTDTPVTTAPAGIAVLIVEMPALVLVGNNTDMAPELKVAVRLMTLPPEAVSRAALAPHGNTVAEGVAVIVEGVVATVAETEVVLAHPVAVLV